MVLLFTAPIFTHAQTKAQLQKQKEELNKQISLTKKLLEETSKGKADAGNQVQLLSKQISLRQRLIYTMSDEIGQKESEIETAKQTVASYEEDLKTLKDEYGKMLYQAWKNRSEYDQMMYIFASDDFNQAYKRLKLMRSYAEVRKEQAQAIKQSQSDLSGAIDGLTLEIEERKLLLGDKELERRKLLEGKKQKENILTELKDNESKLKKQQKQQEAERDKINRAIERMIAEEIRAESKAEGGSFALTPAGKIISQNFEKNKGSLPWPVSRGVIVSKYGKQPHPTIAGLVIENKGIDIATESDMAVRTIFSGEVTSVFSIPMVAGSNVIVTHGSFKTVYTNLTKVVVKPGDKIEANAKLGNVLADGGKNIAHIEIWKVTSTGGDTQNPESWIKK